MKINLIPLFIVISVSLTACENLSIDNIKNVFTSSTEKNKSETKFGPEKSEIIKNNITNYRIEFYKPECEINNLSACNILGKLYQSKGDFSNANSLFLKTCSLNDENGCIYLEELSLLLSEKAPTSSYATLDKYCEKGVSNGYACKVLALHFSGLSSPNKNKDINKATKYFSKACKYNDSDACMALLVENFNSVKEADKKSALANILNKCEVQDEAKGCNYSSMLYGSGVPKLLKKDEYKSYIYGYRACQLGEGSGCYVAGDFIYKGVGIEKNIIKTKDFFEKGCNLSDYSSCVSLGYLYLTGNEIEKDNSKAKHYYQIACILAPSFKENEKERSTYGKTACEVVSEAK